MQRDFSISVPMYTLTSDGAVEPNCLFHRPFSKLHSRCIEYPFAASTMQKGETVLDLGSAQADPLWVDFLSQWATKSVLLDMTPAQGRFQSSFVQADCRHLPFRTASFDRIIAVSVIEHIGLLNPQALGDVASLYSADGDIESLCECARVLKKGGELVLTIPFGIRKGYSPCGTARIYSFEDIERFAQILQPIRKEYYEYQMNIKSGYCSAPYASKTLVGKVTWRRIPIHKASAQNKENMDGILCSVWKKEN